MGVNTKKIFPKSFMAFIFSERLEESKVERLPVNLMSPTYKKRDLLYRKVKSRWSYMPWSRTIQSQVRRYSTFLRMPFLRVLFCPTRMGYSACPWTAACKALRACFWGQLATLWGPPQRKQRRGLEFVVEAPELFDEDDSFLWTGFTRQAGSVHFRHVYQAGIPIHSISSSKEEAQRRKGSPLTPLLLCLLSEARGSDLDSTCFLAIPVYRIRTSKMNFWWPLP